MDWPTIHPLVLTDVRQSHEILPPFVAGDVVFLVADPLLIGDLQNEGLCVMLATTWQGSRVVCGDHTLDAGTTVIRAAWYSAEPSPADVFQAAAAAVETVGLRPVGDLDVALE